MNKAERHAAIRERARAAIRDLYHNATPTYPDDFGPHQFDVWFEGAAESEIEYINDGGAYGTDYARTLRAPCNAGRYQSEAAQRYYVRKGLRDMKRERNQYARWEWTRDLFGKVYTWGRGGRTLAPDSLIKRHGGSSFSPNDAYVDDLSIEGCVKLFQVIEAFNDHVRSWCRDVPDMWREYCAEMDAEYAREDAERTEWEARDVMTV